MIRLLSCGPWLLVLSRALSTPTLCRNHHLFLDLPSDSGLSAALFTAACAPACLGSCGPLGLGGLWLGRFGLSRFGLSRLRLSRLRFSGLGPGGLGRGGLRRLCPVGQDFRHPNE